ncbi:MAG: hypothetical protein ACREDE_10485 [Thermoplasmata archaeon]
MADPGSSTDQLLRSVVGGARDAVHEAARGATEKYDRRYWLACAREGRFTDELWGAIAEQ